MTRLVVRSMRKDDGLLDCSCIMGTDYRSVVAPRGTGPSVNLIGRACKLLELDTWIKPILTMCD